ncbi:MAG: hypothetical protein QW136_00035 [Nitrososphaerales archaeon]
MIPPTPQELGRAVNEGVPVRFGLPIMVERPELGEALILNLVAAHRGDPDPWFAIRTSGALIEVETAGDVGLSIDGLVVQEEDIGRVRRALRLAPPPGTRHDPEADGRRLAAGRAALEIRDAMVRARVLDAVDGWIALEECGKVIDRDPAHGILIEPAAELQLRVKILIVKCPSTGRRYALRVPHEMKTAREARIWTLHGIEPEVET